MCQPSGSAPGAAQAHSPARQHDSSPSILPAVRPRSTPMQHDTKDRRSPRAAPQPVGAPLLYNPAALTRSPHAARAKACRAVTSRHSFEAVARRAPTTDGHRHARRTRRRARNPNTRTNVRAGIRGAHTSRPRSPGTQTAHADRARGAHTWCAHVDVHAGRAHRPGMRRRTRGGEGEQPRRTDITGAGERAGRCG
jgi:hypothetical protein